MQKKNRKKNAITFCYDYVECQITQNETLLDVPHYDRAGHKSAILMQGVTTKDPLKAVDTVGNYSK